MLLPRFHVGLTLLSLFMSNDQYGSLDSLWYLTILQSPNVIFDTLVTFSKSLFMPNWHIFLLCDVYDTISTHY